MALTKEQALKRAAALDALSRSSNEHEAALAAERLSALLGEHDISIGEAAVRAEGVATAEAKTGYRADPWHSILANAVCLLVDADVTINLYKTKGRAGRSECFTFYAAGKDRAAACADMYSRLVDTAKRGYEDYRASGVGRLTAGSLREYTLGFAFAVRGRANQMAKAREEGKPVCVGAIESGAALVLVRRDMVKAALAAIGLDSEAEKKPATKTVSYSKTDAFLAGTAAGQAADLSEKSAANLLGGVC